MTARAKVAAGTLAIAISAVGAFEGRSLVAYLDPISIPTICDGWTRGVKMGDRATDAECDAKTIQALEEANFVFERWVPAEVRAGMGPSTVAAFLSFILNVGPGQPGVKDGFVWLRSGRHSTMLLHLRAGRVREACGQFQYWTSAGDRKLRGLEIRRGKEGDMCLRGAT